MGDFKHFGNSQKFNDVIKSNLAALPTIGDPAPTKILGLVHYSRDSQIQNFHRSTIYSWTDNVSEMVCTVGEITGLKGIVFSAMYIIRVGVGLTYSPRNYDCSFTSEWALDIDVKQGEFAKILLRHDQASNVYIPI
jgi:hypothetical protein